jgi:putative ABC transport system permease protein
MVMTARERQREYATLKALGFGPAYILLLILGESLLISLGAGIAGILLLYPVAERVGVKLGTLFPVFNVSALTLWTALGAAFVVGLVAAVIPAWRAVRMPVTQGLGTIG